MARAQNSGALRAWPTCRTGGKPRSSDHKYFTLWGYFSQVKTLNQPALTCLFSTRYRMAERFDANEHCCARPPFGTMLGRKASRLANSGFDCSMNFCAVRENFGVVGSLKSSRLSKSIISTETPFGTVSSRPLRRHLFTTTRMDFIRLVSISCGRSHVRGNQAIRCPEEPGVVPNFILEVTIARVKFSEGSLKFINLFQGETLLPIVRTTLSTSKVQPRFSTLRPASGRRRSKLRRTSDESTAKPLATIGILASFGINLSECYNQPIRRGARRTQRFPAFDSREREGKIGNQHQILNLPSFSVVVKNKEVWNPIRCDRSSHSFISGIYDSEGERSRLALHLKV